MIKNQKNAGCADSLAGGLTVGAFSAISVTVFMSVILAKMLEIGKITWESIGYWILIQTMIASFLGAKIALVRIKRQRLVVSILSGAIYYGLLLIIATVFFGCQYQGMGVTALLIIAGCGSAMMLGLPTGRIRKRRIKKLSHR